MHLLLNTYCFAKSQIATFCNVKYCFIFHGVTVLFPIHYRVTNFIFNTNFRRISGERNFECKLIFASIV